MSQDGMYLATIGDDKRLKIWNLEPLTLLSARALLKKSTCIKFSRSTDILVSDKFGDLFRYTFHPNDRHTEGTTTGDVLSSHEILSSGEPILGHASLLTSCLLTPDEEYIITADRDEHIRISWYPDGHVIEGYCLGHKKYVSAIHIPTASPTVLISGGGDHELKVWNWVSGCLQQNITAFAAVEPFLAPICRKATAGSKKRRNNSRLEPEDSEDQKSLEDPSTTSSVVFVVHEISSFVSSGEIHVVFSVVGATAIFEFVLAETLSQPDIRYYDFGRPVIDFTVCGEGKILVLLDADFFGDFGPGDEPPRKLVQEVDWFTDKFVDAGSSMLLNSLDTICSLPATVEDLQVLDLYSDLSSLPKTTDREQENRPLEQLTPTHEPSEDGLTGGGAPGSVELTKRALGRLKHKRALDQLHRERTDSHDILTPDRKKMKAGSNNEELHLL